jgi:FKBP-type peptidyl-prolyl cis-trans isomerase FkpA
MKELIVVCCLLFVVGCSPQEPEEKPIDMKIAKEELMKRNKAWHEDEMMDIENFVKRHNWNVVTTGSGLKYVIYKKVDTNFVCAKEGMVARVNYTISLLNDSICYTSNGEPDDFLIGMDNVESGLHEGVTYMRKGEKAKIILSSNLAYGLVGDMEKIPPQSTLVYDLELVEIIDPETKKPVGDEKRKK